MEYKRVLTIQDISCFGQCSGTVALPIISACGHECCIIPSAVLSTHTGGFEGFTFCDLTEELPKIMKHWVDTDIMFDCVYTGYLGSVKQIEYVAQIMNSCLIDGGLRIVDPAMADNGKLYT
ncbi:MAG: phosphomethylpyrimidine kinase, partial [Lachnospiraceae bacterium]|nr:phosphomethylpyrimidine kinase [Lachnospiraceae bacterium]